MPSATGFAALGLDAALVQAAARQGFDAPTPVQVAAIPVALRGADLRATAQTGSGKTAAFALPLLQALLHDAAAIASRPGRRTRALVLVPTRELAAQVGEVLQSLAEPLPGRLKIAIVFGGVSINPQMLRLRGGAEVVVATPGRLLDLLDHNALHLGDVRHLVLDEADRLLDLGFADELARVLALLPPMRQNLFFSATFPPAVQALADSLLREPVRVEIDDTPATLPDIAQRAIVVDERRRTELLRHLLTQEGWTQVLVFVASQHTADHVAWKLYSRGVMAAPFHGGLSQGARKQRLSELRNEQWDVLVTTDLAARGIDIAKLAVVINYDLPRSAIDYVHRIGRTGRAGESGLAVSLVPPAAEAHFRLIEKRQGLRVAREVIEGFAPDPAAVQAAEAAVLAAGTGGIKGKRPSKKDKARAAAAAAGASADASADASTGNDAGTARVGEVRPRPPRAR
ncbi:MAG: DEAD/DEAH box helicase [Burkholderiales bacterium]|nr:DEAD/DEAH box helicase [Burkholderiales bacterium]